MADAERRDPDDRFHGFLSFQSRGVIAIPAELRRRLHADTPGAQIGVTEREDGVFELRPTVPIPADQQGFWTKRWQALERQADDDIAAGRVNRFENADELVEIRERRTTRRLPAVRWRRIGDHTISGKP